MNYLQSQEFFKQLFQDRKVSFEFDQNCYHSIQLCFTDGKLNDSCFCECNKMKMTLDGHQIVYIPIYSQSIAMKIDEVKKYI